MLKEDPGSNLGLLSDWLVPQKWGIEHVKWIELYLYYKVASKSRKQENDTLGTVIFGFLLWDWSLKHELFVMFSFFGQQLFIDEIVVHRPVCLFVYWFHEFAGAKNL